MRRTPRYSLKLFGLACVFAALIVSWFAIRWQSSAQHQRRVSEETVSWTPFSEEGSHAGDGQGGFRSNGLGQILFADVRRAADWEALSAMPEECAELPHLLIFGPEPLSSFEASRFPGLRQLSIGGVDLGSSELSRLAELPELATLSISSYQSDPLPALIGLKEVKGLRLLRIRGDQVKSLDAFPKLSQIDELFIECDRATAEDAERLKQKLDADVYVNIGTGRNPVWIH